MIIPDNVSHREFLEKAKEKGIKINSRFKGVYFNKNMNGSPSWFARVQRGGKLLKFKRFEFTKNGEIAAGKFYERYSKTPSANDNQPTT